MTTGIDRNPSPWTGWHGHRHPPRGFRPGDLHQLGERELPEARAAPPCRHRTPRGRAAAGSRNSSAGQLPWTDGGLTKGGLTDRALSVLNLYHFHRAWPYWFFFCDLREETLTMMTLCLMPDLQAYKRLGEPMAKVEYDPMDLIRFIQKNFGPLNAMMERAGMSERAIYQRTKEVFEHFHLPFDAEPPEG